MKSLQLSILGLVLLVAACALAFMGLKTASELWYAAFYTFTALVLLAAVIAARFRRGNEKAFWFGFAVFGWAFFVMGLGPWPSYDEQGGARIVLNPNLLTSRVVLFLVPYLRKGTDDLAMIDPITANTIGIAHLLMTLAIATAGALLAVSIRQRRGRLVSVKSLSILAGLAVVAAALSSTASSSRSAAYFLRSPFNDGPSLRALAQQNRGAIAYRLSWTPSFHHPVCVRIDRTGGAANLRAVVLDGKGGYDRGQIAIDTTMTLGEEAVRELERQVEQAAFWRMATNEEFDTFTVNADGDTLVVECVKDGAYHVVIRTAPEPPFTRLCRTMLELSGLKMHGLFGEYHPNDDQLEM